VLLSGRGSNYVALQEAVVAGDVPAEIVVVVSNREDAAGLERAREHGVETVVLPHRDASTREEHEAGVIAALEKVRAEWICLAGYMRLLSADFVARYAQRILNIHPSLLPAFPGLRVQEAALEYGVRVSGCTVHLVDEGLDSGPIVVQKAVPVLDGDTPETLAARILEQEHRAYPEALKRLLSEPWTLEGRRVVFGGESAS
jgi:phosphoribosylglycinamide formyltransferase-1